MPQEGSCSQASFHSIISFEWKDGAWTYTNNMLNGDFGIKVPLPGENEVPIDHKRVNHAAKTLGPMASPDRNSDMSIRLMEENLQNWINAVKNEHMHRQNVWFSLKVQFLPRVGYGL